MINTDKINGHTVRHITLDPALYDIHAAYKPGLSVRELADVATADIAINFNYANTQTGDPIGKLIVDGETVIDDIPKTVPRDELYMLPDKSYHIGKAPDDAVWSVQGSPRLLQDGQNVIHGSIARDQLGADIWQRKARRTAVGITADGRLVLASTLGELYLSDMAGVVLELGCIDALNGDGGGSSYLYPVDTGWGRKLGSAIIAKRRVDPNMSYFDDYRMTSPFGWRTSPITGAREWHTGIDLVKAHQSPIYAFVEGEVIHAKEGVTGSGFGGYGIVVAIKDKYGALHCYCHLDSVSVAVGDVIKAGQMIGRQGSTGQSTGSHLHYEIRKTAAPQFGWIADRANNCYEPSEYLINYYTKGDKAKMSDRFKDVPVGHWAERSIIKAAASGVIAGVSEDTFGLGQPVTREQLAVILDRVGLLEKGEDQND